MSDLEDRLYRGHRNALSSVRGGGSLRFQRPGMLSRRWTSVD